ncbi:MAG: DUF3883 domain-containing protein [Oscillospiraceae bacterium]|nr:DUF3883 domain-containing protein [Oscillospiraceae bacterium]
MTEHVVAILYHKIQDSDFTNMYGVKKPTSGGGQTYIQAAGYSREELDKMFRDADNIFNTLEFWDENRIYPRKRYTFQASVVGSTSAADIELAPRTGRKDYRISRQNLKYRHPAWQTNNGFPEPNRNNSGEYIYEKNYPNIIDNLFVLMIKTIREDNTTRFYATYINSENIPSDWPSDVGLEDIFSKNKRQGIIFYEEQYLRFVNDKNTPFAIGSAIDIEIGNIILPTNFNETSDDAVEYASKEISITVDVSNITITKVEAPLLKKKKTRSGKKLGTKDINYTRRYKNLKKIGDIGELLAIETEKRRLVAEGRPDLADRIEHVACTIGDGLGYDILSFEQVGADYCEKYIEVKSTTGSKNKPFDITANEVEVSEEKGQHYSIYRFYGLSSAAKEMRYYECRGPIKENFTLEATAFKAYYKG